MFFQFLFQKYFLTHLLVVLMRYLPRLLGGNAGILVLEIIANVQELVHKIIHIYDLNPEIRKNNKLKFISQNVINLWIEILSVKANNKWSRRENVNVIISGLQPKL